MAGNLIRLEYFHDEAIDKPTAYQSYLYYMHDLETRYPPEMFATRVCDSYTFQALAARKLQEKIINPMVKFSKGTDTRQWYSGEVDSGEEMIVCRYGSMRTNVVLLCHTNRDTVMIANEIVRGPFARGRLSGTGLLCAAYQEIYYTYVYRDEQGVRHYAVKTMNDGQYFANSQLNAPDPCYPDYKAFFSNAPDRMYKPIHLLAYGDTGTGKSSLAKTFLETGNVLVWCFDPHGKDLPYWKGAKKVGDLKTYEIGGHFGAIPITYRDIEF